MSLDLLGLLLANASFAVAGIGVTAAAGWWSSRAGLLRSLPLAYLVGVAAYGVLAQLLLVLGAPLDAWQVLLVCTVAAAGVALRRGERAGALGWSWLALPASAMLTLLLVDLWFQPLWAYDAWTIWTPKARALAELPGLDAAWFTSADVISPDYPLLLPAIEAASFRLTGYELELLDVQSWLLVTAFVFACAHLLGGRATPLATWTVLTMVVFAPSVASQLAAAEADLPVAVLFAVAGLCAYIWLEDGNGSALALAAVLGAGAVATKVEGTLFILALFAVTAVLAWGRGRRDALLTLAAGTAALAFGIAPWRIWMAAHDVASQASAARIFDVVFLANHIGRVPEAAVFLAARLLDPTEWLLVVPLAAFAVVQALRVGRRTGVVLAVAVGGLALAGLLLAYWTTPLDYEEHLATSARRVVTGPILFWAALTPALVGRR